MSIANSRTGTENAHISIDHTKCTLCGWCVKVCKDFSLSIGPEGLVVSETPLFGCMGCGHCEAVCPHDAIHVEGRTLSSDDFAPLVHDSSPDDRYEKLLRLTLNRRSIRDFKDKPVSSEIIQKILDLASTAPMGLPPSDVGVLVIDGKDKVRKFSFDFLEVLKGIKWMFKPLSLSLMRPFMSHSNYLLMKTFVNPTIDFFLKKGETGENYLLYDAPLALMFYGNMSDPADSYIAATYAMLSAESQGIGSCMIGSAGPFLKFTGSAFKQKYGLPKKMNDSIIVIFGHPQLKFNKTIKRTFAKIDYYQEK